MDGSAGAHERDAPERYPNPAPLVAVAYLAPWALVSAFLPDPHRSAAFGLLAALAVLLVAASVWSHRAASERGLDGAHWSFLAVVSLGASMVVLAFQTPGEWTGRVCADCGRDVALDEPFCFRCGSDLV